MASSTGNPAWRGNATTLSACRCWPPWPGPIYEYTEDQAFLAEVYPGLCRFFDAWFKPKHDYDEDGVPEWSHTVQSAFDNNPSFVRWRPWAQGADITLAEAPDLASYLHRESEALSRMAAQLGQLPDPALDQRAARLKAAVNGMWRDETHSYHYVDRDIHEVTRGQMLGTGRGNLTLEVHQKFSPAVRVLVKAIGPNEACPALQITVTGKGRRGPRRVETFRRTQVQWYWGLGTAVSEKTYAEVERVEVGGLTEEFEVTLSTVDYGREDQTLLLPLWARLPEPARAEALVRQTLLDPRRYWRPYGIASCSALDPAYRPDNCEGSGGVWPLWNTMIGEGLVDYGYRAEAAELITRLMTAMLFTLKNEKAFREAYNADRLEGLGERNHIGGVAPVQLFMRTVGVRVISPRRVFLEGYNPFPWPVTIRYKGVTIVKSAEESPRDFSLGEHRHHQLILVLSLWTRAKLRFRKLLHLVGLHVQLGAAPGIGGHPHFFTQSAQKLPGVGKCSHTCGKKVARCRPCLRTTPSTSGRSRCSKSSGLS